MCGIVGIVENDLERPVALDGLQRMVRTLVHRGPDEEGSVALNGVGLAMRRLAIVDLAGGQQPFTNETGDIQLVANGEIYNFPDLRRELEGYGHRFRSRSDIEVLVHGYEQWGVDLLPRIRELAPSVVWQDFKKHLQRHVAAVRAGPPYNLLQKLSYTIVLFIVLPLMIATGLTMSPTITSGYTVLLDIFGGYQTARTVHFFGFAALLLFLIVHIAMVVITGFRQQLRAMTWGK